MEKTNKGGTQTKTKKNLVKDLEETNKAVTTQKVITHRELKYKYPKGCIDTVARKSFRQKVRNSIRRMEREIKKLKGEEKTVLKEKLNAYKEETLIIQ